LPREKEDAFKAAICHYPFIAFDNVDGSIHWFNDALARIATGEKIILRELFTTNKLLEFRPDVFVSLSARTPKFRRDDVVDRLLIFPVIRLEGFDPEKKIIDEVSSQRNLIMSSVLLTIQEALKTFNYASNSVLTDYRMSDFSNLVHLLACSMGEESSVKAALDYHQKIKSVFLLEEDPLLQAILKFTENKRNLHIRHTARSLFQDLGLIAEKDHFQFQYKNPNVLSKRLTNIRHNLPDFGVYLDIIPHTHGNINSYVFYKDALEYSDSISKPRLSDLIDDDMEPCK